MSHTYFAYPESRAPIVNYVGDLRNFFPANPTRVTKPEYGPPNRSVGFKRRLYPVGLPNRREAQG